jgi:hypothetical protein
MHIGSCMGGGVYMVVYGGVYMVVVYIWWCIYGGVYMVVYGGVYISWSNAYQFAPSASHKS